MYGKYFNQFSSYKNNMYPHLSNGNEQSIETRDTQHAQSGVAATYLGNTNKDACFADPPCAIDILRPRPTPFFQVPIQTL